MSDDDDATDSSIPAGVKALKQLDGMRQQQERALVQISEMVKWYGKKAKRFREMVLWERALPEHPQRKFKTLAAVEPERDDPPEIDLLVKHRQHHDRLERTVKNLEGVLENPGTMDPKDYADACKTLGRLADRMLGHLREMGTILCNTGRESATRESNMARLAVEAARLTSHNAQHNDRMAVIYDDSDPDRMTNADLKKILAEAEAKKAIG
jgi:hypothetical protein